MKTRLSDASATLHSLHSCDAFSTIQFLKSVPWLVASVQHFFARSFQWRIQEGEKRSRRVIYVSERTAVASTSIVTGTSISGSKRRITTPVKRILEIMPSGNALLPISNQSVLQ